MHRIATLDELPALPALAVIINCGTKWVTSLALASTQAHAGLPVLLVDCESADDSSEHFARLARRLPAPFYWIDRPLRRHGVTLDALLGELTSARVLLVDSDVEIRTSAVVSAMRDALDARPYAYGAGFLHPGQWMGPQHGVAPCVGFHAERMWIPLVMLRTDAIGEALRSGASFAQRREYRRGPRNAALARWWGLRHRLRAFMPARQSRGAGSAGSTRCDGVEPAFVEHDTGAEMHRALLAGGHEFAALDVDLWGDVAHFHGVSRMTLRNRALRAAQHLALLRPVTAGAEPDLIATVKRRLEEGYGIAIA
ncbi:MAG: hypothetical protein ABI981_06450 [Betaproteobacteria bacterium]